MWAWASDHWFLSFWLFGMALGTAQTIVVAAIAAFARLGETAALFVLVWRHGWPKKPPEANIFSRADKRKML